ncbi:MAG TPA: hypothetical protein DCF63_18015, partial [Planctomycetaceae bacterium]|nr:hypothetical protein [Planctomycetaceae bacterium]
DLPWLAGQRVWYWGDMDAEGFELLARFRQRLPSTDSLMMDMAIWNQHLDLVCRKGSGAGKSLSTDCLELLTPDEQSVYIQCCQQGVWLEQERIPQATVVQCLRNVTGQEG